MLIKQMIVIQPIYVRDIGMDTTPIIIIDNISDKDCQDIAAE